MAVVGHKAPVVAVTTGVTLVARHAFGAENGLHVGRVVHLTSGTGLRRITRVDRLGLLVIAIGVLSATATGRVVGAGPVVAAGVNRTGDRVVAVRVVRALAQLEVIRAESIYAAGLRRARDHVIAILVNRALAVHVAARALLLVIAKRLYAAALGRRAVFVVAARTRRCIVCAVAILRAAVGGACDPIVAVDIGRALTELATISANATGATVPGASDLVPAIRGLFTHTAGLVVRALAIHA